MCGDTKQAIPMCGDIFWVSGCAEIFRGRQKSFRMCGDIFWVSGCAEIFWGRQKSFRMCGDIFGSPHIVHVLKFISAQKHFELVPFGRPIYLSTRNIYYSASQHKFECDCVIQSQHNFNCACVSPHKFDASQHKFETEEKWLSGRLRPQWWWQRWRRWW